MQMDITQTASVYLSTGQFNFVLFFWYFCGGVLLDSGDTVKGMVLEMYKTSKASMI